MQNDKNHSELPIVGDYYRITGIAKDYNYDEIIEITIVDDYSWHANVVVVLPGEAVISDDSNESWTQDTADFKGMLEGTDHLYKLTKVSKEQNPEYFL